MVKLTARGFNLVEKDKNIVDKELKRVEKMLPKATGFDVTISKKAVGYDCYIMTKDAGSFIKGEACAETIEAAVNSAVDVLKRRIRKIKTYFVDKKRKQGLDNADSSLPGFDEELDDFDHNSEFKIVKTKKVLLQMMSNEEAITQMKMLDNSFFIYIGEDGNTRVIYSSDKGYCLLVCDC